MAEILGLDIGGTGTKAALVNTISGVYTAEKIKYATPTPSTPHKVAEVVNKLIDDFDVRGQSFGCGFPAVIKNDICLTAANIDNSWLNVNLYEFFKKATGSKIYFCNDADAAAAAEIKFGQGRNRAGTVILITLGTGIGSGIFVNGNLVPNTEFGHLLYKKSVFEHYASNGARKKKGLSWEEWGRELNVFLNHIELIISPDLIILGGGVSKHFQKYEDYIQLETELVPALMGNDAGIIGAAMLAKDHFKISD